MLLTMLLVLQAQNKDHRQARMVQSMRGKLREAELVADVLKGEVMRSAGWSVEEVNELIIKKTLGGPKRFRPKIREELQNELAALEKKYNRALARLKTNANSTRPPLPPPPAANSSSDPLVVATSAPSPMGGGGGLSTLDLEQVSELVEQVEALRVAVRSRDVTLARYMEEVERARAELRDLRILQDRLAVKERKLEALSDRQRESEALYQGALKAQEAAHEELEQARAEAELYREEGRLESEALKQQCIEQINQVRDLLQR